MNKRYIRLRAVAIFTVLTFSYEIIFPACAWALTGGPSQPEVQSFEPAGTTEMVDLFSGDFNYNIPLMDVGGYPINIAYHSGVTMDQEASWCGLGWNINPGVINRNMRGLPDDFSGDLVKKEFSRRPNRTFGTSFAVSYEIFGNEKKYNITPDVNLTLGAGINYNNYKGVNFTYQATPGLGPENGGNGTSLTAGFSYSTDGGFDVSPSLSYEATNSNSKRDDETGTSMQVGASFNSRSGAKSLNYGFTQSYTKTSKGAMGAKVGISSSHNFGVQTWVPTSNIPSRNIGFVGTFKMGSEFTGLSVTMSMTGSYNQSKLIANSVSKPAYGYLYEEKGYNDKKRKFLTPEVRADQEAKDVLLDFNREKDNTFSKHSTNLPLTSHTYDAYSISGQGISGSYRFHRSDFGVVHDDFSRSSTTNVSAGIELGVGNLAHNGGNLAVLYNTNKTGLWVKDNSFKDYLNFVAKEEADSALYEPAYLKAAGEMTPVDKTFFNKVHNYKTIRPTLGIGVINAFDIKEDSKYSVTIKDKAKENIRKKRDPRNQLMSYLTASEAEKFALDKKIKSVAQGAQYKSDGTEFENTTIDRVSSDLTRKGHHLSEITVTKEDGSRYLYGIPAYNFVQKEKTFNITPSSTFGSTAFNSTGTTTYPSGANSTANVYGIDHYYSSTELPAFAHSYLLSGILSPDYVDILGDGITEDDLGTAVKFNYTRTHANYKWRIPFLANTASLVEGLHHTNSDDKGAYSYGEKEVWMMHSVETKTHVALFITSDREDAMPVENENGGFSLSGDKMKKLDKIILYSKADYINNGNNAIPIKVVHFVYDYSLCPNVDNNFGTSISGNENKGKLTLKEIYFTYGKSNKGRTTPYKFTYSSENPGYNLKGYDRWGTYKPNVEALPNTVYPYTSQNKTNADQYANAWNLKEVYLPSGGKIKVDYEADDYAYVQDKQAMQMFKVKGFGKHSDVKSIQSTRVFTDDIYNHYDILFFELQRPITSGNANDTVVQKYLKGIDNLQFTVYTDINNQGKYEYVKGYAEIDWSVGGGISADGNHGWVAMKMVEIGDKFLKSLKSNRRISPIARTIWNFAKLNTPNLTYPYSEPGENDKLKSVAFKLVSIIPEVLTMVRGFNTSLMKKEFGSKVDLNKSFVRLNTPYKMKYGGGHRVKRIVTNDNWSQMGTSNTSPSSSEYGTEYIYTKDEKQPNGQTMTISSGVASYEPKIGGDENPFVQPRSIVSKNKMVPDDTYLQEEPFGESFFPSAFVGYSRVVVKSIHSQGTIRNGSGYKVSEFFTDYDFPTIVRETDLNKQITSPKPFFSMFEFKKFNTAVASQGYTIELNDMSGKPKSEFTYADGSTNPISGVRYIYKADTTKKPVRLNNSVPTINKAGQIVEEEIGVEFDFVTDMRDSRSKTWNGSIGINLETFMVGVAPIVVPVILPSYSENTDQFNSAVSTKIIKRYGILVETIAYQEGASISSRNLLWDKETGKVLLSSNQNEFEDNIYNYTQPAHWTYEGMGQAYKNINLSFENVKTIGYTFTLPKNMKVNNFFVPGDECILTSTSPSEGTDITTSEDNPYSIRAWVYKGTDNYLNLIDINGDFIRDGTWSLKVIRSGRRNMHNTPVGSITSLKSPLSKTGTNYNPLSFTNVLNTEGTEYKDQWKSFINYLPSTRCDTILSQEGENLFNFLSDLATNNQYKLPDSSLVLQPGYLFSFRSDSFINVNLSHGNEFHWGTTISSSTILYTIDNGLIVSKPVITPYEGFYKKYALGLRNIALPTWYNSSELKAKIDSLVSACGGSSLPQLSFNEVTKKYSLGMIADCSSPCSFSLDFQNNLVFRNVLKLQNFQTKSQNTFIAQAIIQYENGALDTVLTQGSSGCIDLLDCSLNCLTQFYSKPVNPYLTGLEGNWRLWKSHKFLGDRTYNATRPDTRNDGVYSSFVPFWTYNTSTKQYVANSTNSIQWVNATEMTKYSPFGNEMEDKDALDKYSAALFGYKFTLPIATSTNAKLAQIAYDGFEDYPQNYLGMSYLCPRLHWNFSESLNDGAVVDNAVKHSGNFSLRLPGNTFSALIRPLVIADNSSQSFDESRVRVLKNSDDMDLFRPTAGKYLLSAWVKEIRNPTDTIYNNIEIKVQFKDNTGTVMSPSYTFKSKGKIIEDWQRVSEEFEVPSGAAEISIKLNNPGESNAWVDDIRVQPYDGNMKSYAYDYRSSKLLAELDENNYATFYEYDQEGILIRVKKETINGVVTLKEARNHYFKK